MWDCLDKATDLLPRNNIKRAVVAHNQHVHAFIYASPADVILLWITYLILKIQVNSQ